MAEKESSEQKTPSTSSGSSQSGSNGMVGERTLTQGLLYYAAIVWAKKWWIILVTFLAGAGAVAFSIVSLRLPPEESPLPNVYRATARIMVQGDSSGNITETMLAALGVDAPRSGGSADTAQLIVAVLNSRSFVDKIVNDFDIMERYELPPDAKSDSRQIVRSRLTYSMDRNTGTLSISYEDIYPSVARDVTNAMVENLEEWFVTRGGVSQTNRVRTLEAKLLEVETEISRLQSQIREFQAQYGVLDPAEIAESQSALITDLQGELVALDVRIRNRRQLLRVENDPELARLESERENLLQVISEIEAGYTGGARRLPPRSELPELALEHRNLSAELEIQRRIHTALTQQYEVAKLTAETDPAFSVFEYAEVPDEKVRPSRSMLTMQITAGAAAFAIFMVLLLHFFRQATKDPENRRVWRSQIDKAK